MKSHRPRQSAEQWAGIIEQFDKSGLSVKAFCAQHDIALATFSKWQRRIRLQSADKPPAFKQVKSAVAEPTKAASLVTVTLSDNIVLTIQTGASTS